MQSCKYDIRNPLPQSVQACMRETHQLVFVLNRPNMHDSVLRLSLFDGNSGAAFWQRVQMCNKND